MSVASWAVTFFVGVYVYMAYFGKPKLKYFKPSEFGVYWPLMSNDLLLKLDEFRERWGHPVEVSKAPGAVGREGESDSQHNFLKWGEVRAVDVFPKVNGRYISTIAERQRAYQIAKEVGFTGIGIYTDTMPGNMLHLDVRKDRQESNPALWSRVNNAYGSIADVIA